MGSISRLKGFELFKLYQILEAKLTLQDQNNAVSLKINKTLHDILKEAYQILKHDVLIPLALKKLFLNIPELDRIVNMDRITNTEYIRF